MVIDDSDGEDNEPDEAENDAYRESITSVDGFTRGPNGRVKFNKDTKKRRRDNEDLEMMDVDDGDKSQNKQKRRTSVKLGHEFKAKASVSVLIVGTSLNSSVESWRGCQKRWCGSIRIRYSFSGIEEGGWTQKPLRCCGQKIDRITFDLLIHNLL